MAPALRFLKREQETDGSWYGRWGVNYIYGTWSVLAGLRAIGADLSEPYIRRAVSWLESKQNPDGGWGSYDKDNNRIVFNYIPFADHHALLIRARPI